jgi:hypothetical protein
MKNTLKFILVSAVLIIFGSVALAGDPSAPIRPTPLTPAPTQPKLLEKTPPPVLPGLKLPPGALDVPVIEQFQASIPSCSSRHDPSRALLSYRVTPGRGGSKIQRVKINAIKFDPESGPIRVIYEQSAPPGNPWPVAADVGIRDPGPAWWTSAYVLVAWNAAGGSTSKRMGFYYSPEFVVTGPVEKTGPVAPSGFYKIRIPFRYHAIDLAARRMEVSIDGMLHPVAALFERGPTEMDRVAAWWEDNNLNATRARVFTLRAYGLCDGRAYEQTAVLPAETRSGSSPPPPPPAGGGPPGPSETTTACCSSGTPGGYYKTDDSWSATTCGSPSSIAYNVCTYQRYNNKSVGATMSICNGQPLAAEWVQTDTSWIPTRCGHNISGTHNVETVRRIR